MKIRILAFFIVLILAGFTVGMKIAAHPAVDRWLRKSIIEQAEKHLGVHVQLGKLERNIILTRLTLNDVTLRDLTGSGNSISLSRLAVVVDPFAFLRGKVKIKDLKLEGMFLDIVRTEEGTIAVDPLFPFWRQQHDRKGKPAWLGLEIGNVAFLDVDLAFRDIPAGVHVNLDGVTIFLVRNRFDPTDRRTVNLRAKTGNIKWRVFPENRSVAIDSLSGSFEVASGDLHVSALGLDTGPVKLELSGTLPLNRNAAINGNLSVAVDIGELPWLITGGDGMFTLVGRIGGDLRSPAFRGQLSGNNITMAGREIRRMGADIYLDTQGTSLTSGKIEYRGEELFTEADVRFKRSLPFNMRVRTGEYPLRKILEEVGAGEGADEGVVDADLMIEGRLSGGESVVTMGGRMAVPMGDALRELNFDLSGIYEERSLKNLLFNSSSQSMKLVMGGRLAPAGPELDLFLTDEDLSSWHGIPGLEYLSGSLTLTGSASGTWQDVKAGFDLSLISPSWTRYRGDIFEAHIDLDNAGLDFPRIMLKTGSTVFSGRASIPVNGDKPGPWLNISTANGRIEDVLRAAGLDYDVVGELEGSVHLSYAGSEAAARGRIVVKSGSVLIEPFDEISITGNMIKDVFTAQNITVVKDGRRLQGSGIIRGSTYKASMRSVEPILLESVEYLNIINVPLAGEITLSADMSGDIVGEKLSARTDLTWERITYDGRDWRSGRGTFVFDGPELQAQGELLDGEINANINVDVRETVPFSGTIVTPSDIDRAGLNDFLGLKMPEDIVAGRITVRADASGILTNVNKTKVEGVITDADFSINGIHFVSRDSVPFNYFPETGIHFTSMPLRSGESSIDGTLRIAPGAGIEGSVDGSIGLEGMSFLKPTVDSFRGQARTKLQVTGHISEPVLNGSVEVSGVQCVAHLPFDLPLRNLDGKLEIVGNRLHIGEITGEPESGRLSMSGELFMSGFKPVQGSLTWKAEDVPVQFPEGLDTINRADLGLRFSDGKGFLRGTIFMDRGTYTRNIDLDNLIALIGESSAVRDASRDESVGKDQGRWLNLDVEMITASPLIVDIKLVRGEASGSLHLRGTAADPLLTGRLEMTEGTIEYRGHSFEVNSGSVGFVNARLIEPNFDFSGRTEVTGFDREGVVTDYTVELLASGVPEKFKLDLVSSPALSETDIISLLTWGAVGEQAFASRAGLSAVEATLLLTRELRGKLETEVERVTGFDRFTINPSSISSSGERTTRIQVDKKLSDKFYLTYSTPILASEEQEVQVKYRITRSLSLIGEQLGERDYGLDLDLTFEIK